MVLDAIYNGIKKNKTLRNKPTQGGEDSHKTLSNEIKEDMDKWKDIQCSQIGRLSFVMMSILRNVIYRFNATSFKTPMAFFSHK